MGPVDIVATRYGVAVQGATEIALTKIDILSYMEQIPICVQYELNGVKTDDFPFTAAVGDAKPVIEYMPGWQCDVSKCRTRITSYNVCYTKLLRLGMIVSYVYEAPSGASIVCVNIVLFLLFAVAGAIRNAVTKK